MKITDGKPYCLIMAIACRDALPENDINVIHIWIYPSV